MKSVFINPTQSITCLLWLIKQSFKQKNSNEEVPIACLTNQKKNVKEMIQHCLKIWNTYQRATSCSHNGYYGYYIYASPIDDEDGTQYIHALKTIDTLIKVRGK